MFVLKCNWADILLYNWVDILLYNWVDVSMAGFPGPNVANSFAFSSIQLEEYEPLDWRISSQTLSIKISLNGLPKAFR